MTKIYNIVTEALEENQDIPLKDISKDTPIYGKGGHLDSLSLVTFLIDLEQKIEDEYNEHITIADDKAMSQKNSPFKTVDSLINFINQKLKISE